MTKTRPVKAEGNSLQRSDQSTRLVWTGLNFTTPGGGGGADRRDHRDDWTLVWGLLIFPGLSSVCGHPRPADLHVVTTEPAVTIVIGNSQNLFDPSHNNKTCYYFHQLFLKRETKPGDHDQPVLLFTQKSWIIRISKNNGITVELEKSCLAFLMLFLEHFGTK